LLSICASEAHATELSFDISEFGVSPVFNDVTSFAFSFQIADWSFRVRRTPIRR